MKPGFVPIEDVQRFVPSRVRQARAAEQAGQTQSGAISKVAAVSNKVDGSATEGSAQHLKKAADPPSWRRAVKPAERKAIPENVATTEVPDSWEEEDQAETDQTNADSNSVDAIVDGITSIKIDREPVRK